MQERGLQTILVGGGAGNVQPGLCSPAPPGKGGDNVSQSRCWRYTGEDGQLGHVGAPGPCLPCDLL